MRPNSFRLTCVYSHMLRRFGTFGMPQQLLITVRCQKQKLRQGLRNKNKEKKESP